MEGDHVSDAVKISEDDRPVRGVPIGDLDTLEAFIGLRGVGKSTYLCERVWDRVTATPGGCYVVGHSMGPRLPERLPGGGPILPITYHENVAALDRGLRRHPERWHIVASDTIPADEVIRYVRRLSLGIREAVWRRKHLIKRYSTTSRLTGERATPICVIVDEGIAVEAGEGGGKTGSNKDSWFKAWLFSLRHEHTALYYAIQNSNARSWLLVDQATAIHVFRTRHEWALSAIRAGCGATEVQLAQIRELPRYEHLTFR